MKHFEHYTNAKYYHLINDDCEEAKILVSANGTEASG